MNTQTHLLMGALIFGKPLPRLAWAGAAGGIVPDLPMYAIIGGLRLQGHSLETIFRDLYWEDWWQIANGLGHSFWLWGLIALGCALALRSAEGAGPYDRGGPIALCFALAASALIHSAIDFLCHRSDAHMHLWPFTEWRFLSPVSYWDPAHYGREFSLFEALLGITMAGLLMRRYRNIGLRLALAIAVMLYVAVPAFFILNLV